MNGKDGISLTRGRYGGVGGRPMHTLALQGFTKKNKVKGGGDRGGIKLTNKTRQRKTKSKISGTIFIWGPLEKLDPYEQYTWISNLASKYSRYLC